MYLIVREVGSQVQKINDSKRLLTNKVSLLRDNLNIWNFSLFLFPTVVYSIVFSLNTDCQGSEVLTSDLLSGL